MFIVGGGPLGLAMTLLLDRFGIDCILAEREPTTTEHPKSRGCLARTMELFRQWAIEEAIRARGSSGVATQIFETPRKISDHSKQHVHRCRLDVPSGLPTRDCIDTKPQEPRELGLGKTEALLEQHHDLKQVRALLGHARIDTTQMYASIRPPQLKRAVSFYEEQATRMLSTTPIANGRREDR